MMFDHTFLFLKKCENIEQMKGTNAALILRFYSSNCLTNFYTVGV